MKIETIEGLFAASRNTPGHTLLLDINGYDRMMESFPSDFLQECKTIVEIDRGAGLGFVRKSRAVHKDNFMAVEGRPAVFIQ